MTRFKWKDMSEEVKAAAMLALSGAGEYILQKSNETVPHDEGHLMRSGLVSQSTTKPEVHISYDTPYARRLHEHPEYNFRNGRRGKWLEETMKEEKKKVRRYIADELRKALD